MNLNKYFLTILIAFFLSSCALKNHPNEAKSKMKEASVIEIVIYQTKENVNDGEHLKKSKAITPILSKFNGFIYRLFSKGENGKWVDLVYWKDLSSAQDAAKKVKTIPECQLFFNDINEKNMEFMHTSIVEHYP